MSIKTVTRTAFATVTLSVAAMSLPAAAGTFDDESLILKQHDYACQSIQKATRTLRKWNYKHIEYEGLAKQEYVYVFYAEKKHVPWVVYYDACDREIIGRDVVKKEAEQKM